RPGARSTGSRTTHNLSHRERYERDTGSGAGAVDFKVRIVGGDSLFSRRRRRLLRTPAGLRAALTGKGQYSFRVRSPDGTDHDGNRTGLSIPNRGTWEEHSGTTHYPGLDRKTAIAHSPRRRGCA